MNTFWSIVAAFVVSLMLISLAAFLPGTTTSTRIWKTAATADITGKKELRFSCRSSFYYNLGSGAFLVPANTITDIEVPKSATTLTLTNTSYSSARTIYYHTK